MGSVRRPASPRPNSEAMPCASDQTCRLIISAGGRLPSGNIPTSVSAAVRSTPKARSDAAREEWRAKREEWRAWKRGNKWGRHASSGNVAFDEYRVETLRKLDEEQREFRDYLDRLRSAKDRAEFDQFMNERRSRPPQSGHSGEPPATPPATY